MPGVQEAAELQAMIDMAGFGDPRDAIIARLTEELAARDSVVFVQGARMRRERDSLSADLAALRGELEQTEDAWMTWAKARVASDSDKLAALRGRVEEAVARLSDEFWLGVNKNRGTTSRALSDFASEVRAILAPEGEGED